MSKKNSKKQNEENLQENEEVLQENEEVTSEEAAEEVSQDEASEATESASDDKDEKIKSLEEQLKNEQDKYMRLFAEFDNFRKRTSKEKTEAYGDAAAKTISELLPAIDNFDRALDTPCEDANFKKGIEMIFSQLSDIFAKLGVTEIEALGKPFDPNLHNAIKQVDNPDGESDVVCEVFQKGYKLGDRIIRHSMVAVNA